MLGLIEHEAGDLCKKHGVKTQGIISKKLMRTKKNTEYGKKCNFKGCQKQIKDYQDIVPLSTMTTMRGLYRPHGSGRKEFDNHLAYRQIRRVLGQRGQAEIYPTSPPVKPRLPVLQLQRARRLRRQIFPLKGQKAPAAEGTAHIEITSHKLPCGKTVSCLSGIPLMYLKPIVPLYLDLAEKRCSSPKRPSKMHCIISRYFGAKAGTSATLAR